MPIFHSGAAVTELDIPLDYATVDSRGRRTLNIGASEGVALPAAMDVRYVSGTGSVVGSDSNTGLTPTTAYATVQAAYTALPAEGGTLILLNGTHSLGTGFSGTATKPAVITSLVGLPVGAGYFPSFTAQGTNPSQIPTVTCTGATHFTIVSDGVNQGRGWAFRGLSFDMRSGSNLTGIWANDLNFLRVSDCVAEGRGVANNFLVRSNYTSLASDASWYRIENNDCRLIGLCSLADGETDGNCNNNQITNNVVFGCSGFAIKIAQAQRTTVMGNNLEGDNTMSGVQWLSNSHYNYTTFNGGEQGITPYVQYEDGCYGNVHFNFGSPASGGILVNDIDSTNSSASGSFNLSRTFKSYSTVQTNDFTLGAGNYHGQLQDVNKASAVTATVPLQASAGIHIGSNLRIRQLGAGQVTIAPEGGVTIQAPDGLKTRAQYSVVELQKIAANTWVVWGDTHMAPGVQVGAIARASSNFTTTQTVAASADTALTLASITFDGTMQFEFRLSCMATNSLASGITYFTLWEDSTDLGALARVMMSGATSSGGQNLMTVGSIFRTPAAGAKVYTIRGYVNGNTGTMYLGNGTTVPPATFTITRV